MSFGVESYDLVFLTKGCEKAIKGCKKTARRYSTLIIYR